MILLHTAVTLSLLNVSTIIIDQSEKCQYVSAYHIYISIFIP